MMRQVIISRSLKVLQIQNWLPQLASRLSGMFSHQEVIAANDILQAWQHLCALVRSLRCPLSVYSPTEQQWRQLGRRLSISAISWSTKWLQCRQVNFCLLMLCAILCHEANKCLHTDHIPLEDVPFVIKNNENDRNLILLNIHQILHRNHHRFLLFNSTVNYTSWLLTLGIY